MVGAARSVDCMTTKSRVAVVTGATQGLGLALVDGLMRRMNAGDTVYLTGRDPDRIERSVTTLAGDHSRGGDSDGDSRGHRDTVSASRVRGDSDSDSLRHGDSPGHGDSDGRRHSDSDSDSDSHGHG